MTDKRTNILLITADDMDFHTPGSCGGQGGVTPAIDAFAATGRVFHRAHVVVAVCQPSRSAIVTGRLPHQNGAEGFGPIDDAVPVLNDLLRPAGYLTGILGKVEHLAPVGRFHWDRVAEPRELGQGRNPQRYAAVAREFYARAVREERPWFLMVNSHDPHRPFHGSAQEEEKFATWFRDGVPSAVPPSAAFEPGTVPVPGFLPDLHDVRVEYAQYLSSSRRCDDTVAAVLAELDAAALADNTLVVFLSDNGMSLPFAKANCYLQSTHTPLIVRWPGVTDPGSADPESMLTTLDLLPTFCEAAGVPAPDGIGGQSLVPLLRGEQSRGDAIFTVFHETAGKGRYEMRCVQDATTGYIWNAWSDGEHEYLAENMRGLSWSAMLDAARTEGRGWLAERVEFYAKRVPEELYDLASDPDSLDNLVAVPDRAGTLRNMRARLLDWMRENDDPLASRFEQSVVAV